MSFPVAMFNQKANAAGVNNRGFPPELYTVANGSYAADPNYSMSAGSVNSYAMAGYQLPRGTTSVELLAGPPPLYVNSTEGCDIRQQDRDVDFVVSVCLDARRAAPAFGDEELRIRPNPHPRNRPRSQYIPLPVPKRDQTAPTVTGVEITDKSGAQIAPDTTAGAGSWVLGARVLKNGILALTKKDLSVVGTQETALQADEIDSTFGAANDVIFITVRGTYKAEIVVPGQNLAARNMFA